MHIVGRAEQWGQRQHQNQDCRSGEALQCGSRYDPGAAAKHDATGRDNAQQAADDIRPNLAFQTTGNREQQK